MRSPAQLLLHESQLIRDPAAASAVHEELLIRYAAASHRALALSYRPETTYDDGHGSTSAIAAPPAARSPSRGSSLAQRVIAHAQQEWRGLDSNDNGSSTQNDGADSRSTSPAGAGSTSRPPVDARLARVRQIGTAYVPSARVWSEVFSQEAAAAAGFSHAVASGANADGVRGYSGHVDDEDDARVLRLVYEFWRQRDGVEATVAWAAWLLRTGNGKDAVAVIARARSVLGETDGETVERRWKAILDGDAAREGGAGEEHEDDGAADTDPMNSDEA